jgi:cellulase/cellobiase CelA1
VSATVVSQPTAAARSSTTAAVPALAVTYVIDNKWPNGFQGEVRVTNHTAQAISGWQIAVAVPQDRFNTWWNATGGMSNGVLSLNQPSWSGPLEPGQTLHAYFNATGWQTSPTVCTFNGITCATS